MPDLKEDLVNAAKERWHTKTGLLLALVVVCGPLIVAFAGIDLSAVSYTEWLVVVGIAFVLVVVWKKTRLPRVPKGVVGFGIAIECENSESSQKTRGDLILALRENLTGSPFRRKFELVEFSPSITEQLWDQDRAAAIARSANVHFLLYGRVRLRQVAGGLSHVLDLRGLVRHKAIQKLVSEEFGKDFGAALPRRVVFGSEQGLLACEVAAGHIDVAAKYIIGVVAAAISNDLAYAEQLLLDSERRLKGLLQHGQGVPLSVLLDRIQGRLRELYQASLMSLLRRYTLKRDVAFLGEAEAIISKLLHYDPNNYAAHQGKAMCAFLLRRDLETAKREIDACRMQPDGTWHYNLAFLEAYEGNLDAAYEHYKRAFTASIEDATVPTQCEEFMQIVLDEEPTRTWLYYCLGLINYRAKGDLEAAHKDFLSFTASVSEERFPAAVTAARKWIAEIERRLEDRRS